ncbi:hypothetical protein [Rhodococcus zopfii]|uniref:hypothetical protein n=1 Tax=Rhodococcus zopfii TaxID=43772 RepID=UPI0011114124|nr:hypothetical protein [Rhodococcus zopfii]
MTDPNPITARTVLLPGVPPDRSAAAVADVLGRLGAVRAAVRALNAITPDMLAAVDAEVATAIADLFEVRLEDLFAQGWQCYRRLRDAATASLGGGKQAVPLDSTRITSTQHPFVELSLDGAPVGRIDIDLTAEYDLHGVVAVVESGALTALRFGECDVTVTFAVRPVGTVLQRRRTFSMGALAPMREPVPLVGSARARPA